MSKKTKKEKRIDEIDKKIAKGETLTDEETEAMTDHFIEYMDELEKEGE